MGLFDKIRRHAAIARGDFATLYPGSRLLDPAVMNAHRIVVIVLTMGFSCVAMVPLKCVHPPAAASALIAAMGYLVNIEQVLGIIAAVNLIVLAAIIFNRIIGGLPYPLWRWGRPLLIKLIVCLSV